jgi:mercuric reductase
MTYDLAIVGAGSAAFAAAIHARRKNLRVVMLERDEIGGTCVNVGCIPSKALLAAAQARHSAGMRRFPGIETAAGPVQMVQLVGGKDAIVRDLRQQKYLDLARDYGWEIVHGAARFVRGPALDVNGRRVEALHYLIATGSTPWAPPIDGLEETGYLTSTTAMELSELPDSLLVIGGNYVGLELGQLFARLGSTVTIVEALDRIAPFEEPEISQALAGVFGDEGMVVYTSAKVVNLQRDAGEIVAHVDAGGRSQQLRASQLVVATGRRPDTARLNLEAVGVRVGARGEVVVDEQLRTTNPRIWAAGDVTGHPQFVYVAGAHGVAMVDNAFENAGRTMAYHALPRVTFTNPNIASVGLTEAEAEKAGLDCHCRTIALDVVPRALVNRDTRGLVKIVAERETGLVRGVHMLAHNAGDAILAGVYAIECGMTVDRMAHLWCPYLTMSEGIKLAAQAFTLDVAKLSCCGA